MSTKICEAYKLPSTCLSDFLSQARDEIIADTAETIASWMRGLRPEYVEMKIKEAADNNPIWRNARDNAYHRYYLCMVPILESEAGRRFDSSFNVWIDGQHAYVIPYTRFEFPKPGYLVDFAYWDNADAPEDIDKKEWERRGEKWQRICLYDWDRTRLVHTVVDYSSPYHIGAFEIEKKLGLWDHLRMKGVQ